MKNSQWVFLGTAAAIALVSAALLINPAAQWPPLEQAADDRDVAAIYRGRTIRLLVPSVPGGGFDAYSRLLAPFLEKYTGAAVRVLNLPGAGGMRAVNELYNSPADGMSLSIFGGTSLITNKLAGIKGADYEVEGFEYLGRVAADTRVLYVTAESGLDEARDLMRAAETIRLGATGLGGSGYVDGVISKEAFGLNSRVIHGFDSLGRVTQSLKRGDLHGAWGPWGSVRDTVRSGTEQVILQSGRERNPDLPDIPTVFELIDQTTDPVRTRTIVRAWDALTEVGIPIATSPRTPRDRVSFLRHAFHQAMHDPAFIRMTEKMQLPIQYATAEEIMDIIRAAVDLDPDIEELFIKAVRGEI